MTTYYANKYSLSNGGKITAFETKYEPTEYGFVFRQDGEWPSVAFTVDKDAHTTALQAENEVLRAKVAIAAQKGAQYDEN